MTDLTPWTITAVVNNDEIYFRTPPAKTITFHRANEIISTAHGFALVNNMITGATEGNGDMIITADAVQIARLEGCTAVYATPDEGDDPWEDGDDPGHEWLSADQLDRLDDAVVIRKGGTEPRWRNDVGEWCLLGASRGAWSKDIAPARVLWTPEAAQ